VIPYPKKAPGNNNNDLEANVYNAQLERPRMIKRIKKRPEEAY